ncbi:DUF3106 domain-containing protein [Lysobacter sp. HA18]
MKRFALSLAPVALLLAALPSHAQSTTAALPDWDHLTQAQRDMLIAPMRERWNASPETRQRMFGHAQRWKTMTPDQRKQARHGLAKFQDMSPAEREQARAAFERFRSMSPEDKKALREKLRGMTPDQRKTWLQSQSAQH